MTTEITFTIDDSVSEKLDIALDLNGETLDEALDYCIKSYIAKAFSKAAKDIGGDPSFDKPNEFYGKAKSKIPKWAYKPTQNNFKIIRAFLMAQDIADTVTLQMMEQICSDESRPDVFCPTFKSNYNQMKYDNVSTHGKVFEDNGYEVWLWDEIKDTVAQYANCFYQPEQEE